MFLYIQSAFYVLEVEINLLLTLSVPNIKYFYEEELLKENKNHLEMGEIENQIETTIQDLNRSNSINIDNIEEN